MSTVLAAIIFLGICVFGMCFNIVFRKDGKFPETEVSKNENMRKMGIKCMHETDQEIFGRRSRKSSCDQEAAGGGQCEACGLCADKVTSNK